MPVPLVEIKTVTRIPNNHIASAAATKEINHNRHIRTVRNSTGSQPIGEGLSKTKRYSTAMVMAKMINNNQNFNPSSDGGSHYNEDEHGIVDMDDIDDFNMDYDGDSITEYGGTDLDVESQHHPKKRLTPTTDDSPRTTEIEFDPLALGRESTHKDLSKVSGEEQSSSGKNSVTSFSDKTSGEGSKKKKAKSNSRVKTIVKGETRRIRRWKLASIIVVVVVGLLFSLVLFWHMYKTNVDKYDDTNPEASSQQDYYQKVLRIEETANTRFTATVKSLERLSLALTDHANRDSSNNGTTGSTEETFPFVTLPNFPALAREFLEIGQENSTNTTIFKQIFWSPVVTPTSKVDWERYSVYHQGWIMDTDGSDGVSDMWLGQEDKQYLSPEAMTQNISPRIHDNLSNNHGDHGVLDHNGEVKKTSSQMTFLPAWQTLDFDHIIGTDQSQTDDPQLACDIEFVNLDLFSYFSAASAAFSDRNDDDLIGYNLDQDTHMWNYAHFESHSNAMEEGSSTVYVRVPVHNNLRKSSIVGYVFASLKTELSFFLDIAMEVSAKDQPLRLVVKEERNGRKGIARKRTYELRGEETKFLGNTDVFDKKYEDNAYNFKLMSLSFDSTSSTTYSLYPTPEFYETARENDKRRPTMSLSERYPAIPAVWSASLVCSVFAVILIMFVCYDNSVEDRQRKLLRQAERTDAIVGSMFPANIQGRLMMIDDDTIESSQRQKFQIQGIEQKDKDGKYPPMLTGFDTTGNEQPFGEPEKVSTPITNSSIHTSTDSTGTKPPPLLGRMGRKHGAGNWNQRSATSGVDESILRFGNTKPMADFYPNTTILMCDIAGFTAWSSARAPADVFRLLETIYGAFDDIARAEKVFKVETVGDCYVACAGLPVRQPKHAVIMAKFAKKALKRYDTLIKKLETYLGPDTVDLGLRIGIHSGPVTAGVLRGDKTRFQLFGDTVNTASRMESTGKVNWIQVSPQTAKLLKEEGLGKWVTPRENLVSVKGKGQMQTFWLVRSGATAMSSNLSQPSITSSMGSPKLSKNNNMWKMNNSVQQRRNSMGASNASWETSSTGTQSSGSVSSHPQRRNSNTDSNARNSKERRLIEWMVETFMKSLKKIATHRMRNGQMCKEEDFLNGKELSLPVLDTEAQIIEEIKEVIPISQKDQRPSHPSLEGIIENGHAHVAIPRVVERQLRDYVTVVSLLYHDHAFHNFEHCAHVLMSVLKLLSRILESKMNRSTEIGESGHGGDNAYGITTDPLLEFACLFSALIHDVDHSGVPNSQLVKENTTTAVRYHNRSVAEQHSIAVAWSLLMQPCYKELRECIYRTETEFDRFRQLVVNSVMATDIMDRELKKFRDNRWEKAFDLKKDFGVVIPCTENCNRMATVVIEHMIQASDVAHTMQHWHVYLKFNERLFKEMYQAYKEGRAEKDPSEYWYEGELNFFKFYIIPLALKLKECGVFGVSGDEYFFHAESNRSEWALKGREIVEQYMGRASRDSSRNNSRSNSPNPNPMLTHELLKLPEENVK